MVKLPLIGSISHAVDMKNFLFATKMWQCIRNYRNIVTWCQKQRYKL